MEWNGTEHQYWGSFVVRMGRLCGSVCLFLLLRFCFFAFLDHTPFLMLVLTIIFTRADADHVLFCLFLLSVHTCLRGVVGYVMRPEAGGMDG
jgi:hypothetical protein